METLNQKSVSNWLTVIPTTDQGYELSKEEFWDAIFQIRFDWPLDRVPSHCAWSNIRRGTHAFVQERWLCHVETMKSEILWLNFSAKCALM